MLPNQMHPMDHARVHQAEWDRRIERRRLERLALQGRPVTPIPLLSRLIAIWAAIPWLRRPLSMPLLLEEVQVSTSSRCDCCEGGV